MNTLLLFACGLILGILISLSVMSRMRSSDPSSLSPASDSFKSTATAAQQKTRNSILASLSPSELKILDIVTKEVLSDSSNNAAGGTEKVVDTARIADRVQTVINRAHSAQRLKQSEIDSSSSGRGDGSAGGNNDGSSDARHPIFDTSPAKFRSNPRTDIQHTSGTTATPISSATTPDVRNSVLGGISNAEILSMVPKWVPGREGDLEKFQKKAEVERGMDGKSVGTSSSSSSSSSGSGDAIAVGENEEGDTDPFAVVQRLKQNRGGLRTGAGAFGAGGMGVGKAKKGGGRYGRTAPLLSSQQATAAGQGLTGVALTTATANTNAGITATVGEVESMKQYLGRLKMKGGKGFKGKVRGGKGKSKKEQFLKDLLDQSDIGAERSKIAVTPTPFQDESSPNAWDKQPQAFEITTAAAPAFSVDTSVNSDGVKAVEEPIITRPKAVQSKREAYLHSLTSKISGSPLTTGSTTSTTGATSVSTAAPPITLPSSSSTSSAAASVPLTFKPPAITTVPSADGKGFRIRNATAQMIAEQIQRASLARAAELRMVPYHGQTYRLVAADGRDYVPEIVSLAVVEARAKSDPSIKLPDMSRQRAVYEKENLKLHLCNGVFEAYSASYLTTKHHMLAVRSEEKNLTWVNCEMASFIHMRESGKFYSSGDHEGIIMQSLDVLDFSVIHLSAYERSSRRHRFSLWKTKQDLKKEWTKIDPVIQAGIDLERLNNPRSKAPIDPNRRIVYSKEALRTVVIMPFLGGAMGAGHSELGNRFEYLKTCFWSFYEFVPHIVAAVTRKEDVEWGMKESGLPFFDMMLIENLPKSASLPVATTQHTKQRLLPGGKWAELFDYVFFTESDQILISRQLQMMYAHLKKYPGHMLLPHRLMPYSDRVIHEVHKHPLELSPRNGWMNQSCCLPRQNCVERKNWLPIAHPEVSVINYYGLYVPLGNVNFLDEQYRHCTITPHVGDYCP